MGSRETCSLPKKGSKHARLGLEINGDGAYRTGKTRCPSQKKIQTARWGTCALRGLGRRRRASQPQKRGSSWWRGPRRQASASIPSSRSRPPLLRRKGAPRVTSQNLVAPRGGPISPAEANLIPTLASIQLYHAPVVTFAGSPSLTEPCRDELPPTCRFPLGRRMLGRPRRLPVVTTVPLTSEKTGSDNQTLLFPWHSRACDDEKQFSHLAA